MKLTPLERDILNHRLDVPECIAEAIEQPFDLVYDICGLLHEGKWDEAMAKDADISRQALVDAVEGSTYYGSEKDSESHHRIAAVERASISLARKVSEFTGIECEPPLC